MQWPAVGMRVWEAEPRGGTDGDDGKSVHEQVRLLREAPELVPAWWHDVEAFVASINTIPWFEPPRDPDPAWRVFATRDAAGDAAWNDAWDVARNTAWNAARSAAWNTAWGAAQNAARNAAWDAAGDAAWDAAGDAALLAAVIVCNGLGIDRRHIAHAYERWAVWTAGYGLLADVGGTFYVYRRPS